jgi:hypothetical protein
LRLALVGALLLALLAALLLRGGSGLRGRLLRRCRGSRRRGRWRMLGLLVGGGSLLRLARPALLCGGRRLRGGRCGRLRLLRGRGRRLLALVGALLAPLLALLTAFLAALLGRGPRLCGRGLLCRSLLRRRSGRLRRFAAALRRGLLLLGLRRFGLFLWLGLRDDERAGLRGHRKRRHCHTAVRTGERHERIKRAADHFVEIDAMNDHAVAEMIHRDGIDILVDLMG